MNSLAGCISQKRVETRGEEDGVAGRLLKVEGQRRVQGSVSDAIAFI